MNHEVVESFAQMVREKGIDKDILIGIVEDIFGMMIKKKYGQTANFDVVVNMEKGDIEIFLKKDVVETVEDPAAQMTAEEASRRAGDTVEVGEEYVEIVPMADFGRRLVISAKQNLNQRIKEIEREAIYNEYSNALGEIVVGEIYQIRKGKGEVLVIHNKNELIIPRNEQIYKERYKKGDTIRAVVKEVRKGAGNPLVIISRADSSFLLRLFEIEIPEIYDGIIEIKRIAREPGDRAKVAVLSHDERIDAVGACVGMKGVRIHAIVRELNNENIDVINYTEDPTTFIQRSLAPAKLKEIRIDVETKKATILVAQDQVSLAIGKGGQNIRLASKLTGYDLTIEKEGGDEEEEYDMDLSEFREELGDVLFHKFFDENYHTVRDVVETPREELLAALGIDPERLDEIVTMLRKGLEEAEVESDEEAASKSPAKDQTEKVKADEKDLLVAEGESGVEAASQAPVENQTEQSKTDEEGLDIAEGESGAEASSKSPDEDQTEQSKTDQ